jgi:hypothetical protein
MFLPAEAVLLPIREDDAYGGRRIELPARLGSARIQVQVDIGIGDIVTPAPEWIDYPSLLDAPRPRLRAYSRESVIAEKLHAIVVLGIANSRLKDDFDLHALLRDRVPDAAILANAIAATFERRRTRLPREVPTGLSDAFANAEAKVRQWSGFLKKNRLIAPALDVVVADLRSLLLAPMMIAARSTE